MGFGSTEPSVLIKEEDTPTGGHYGVEMKKVSLSPSTGWTNHDFTWPIPISLLAAQWNNESANAGDELEFHINPDTTVGTLSAQMDLGTNTASFTVPSSLFVGMWIEIDGNDLGRITAIADDLTSVTTENNAPSNILSGKVVKVTVKMSPHIYLQATGRFALGESKIGGSYLNTGTVVRIRYNNVDGQAKDFCFGLEYLY